MFKLDSPLVNFLNKVADILILGVVFMIACIPVITAGAAFTAAYKGASCHCVVRLYGLPCHCEA